MRVFTHLHTVLTLAQRRFSFGTYLSVLTCRRVSREIKMAKLIVYMDDNFSNHTENLPVKAKRT